MEKTELFWVYAIQLERYCSYQERCKKDVINKMIKLEVNSDMHDSLLEHLVKENMLNESRFALSFSNGKFRYKHWGKVKIYSALSQKGINKVDVESALSQIDTEEYLEVLEHLMENKYNEIGGISEDKNKKRLLNYLLQKGYESHLIWELFKKFNY